MSDCRVSFRRFLGVIVCELFLVLIACSNSLNMLRTPAHCRAGGFIDRAYPNVIIVSFGLRDADVARVSNIDEWERGGEYRGTEDGVERDSSAAAIDSKAAKATSAPSATLAGTPDADSTVVCSRVAMKLALLAAKFRRAMVRYEYAHRVKEAMKMNSLSSATATTNARKAAEDAADATHFTRLLTHIGVHACDVPVSSLKPPELRPGYIAQSLNTYGGVLGATDEQDENASGKVPDADDGAASESKMEMAKQHKANRRDDDGSRSDGHSASEDDDEDDSENSDEDDSDEDVSDDFSSSGNDDDSEEDSDDNDAEEAARARALAEGSFFRSSSTSATAPEKKRRVTKLSRSRSTNGSDEKRPSASPRKRNSASGALDGSLGKYTRRASRRASNTEEEKEAQRLRRRRRRKRRRRRRRRRRAKGEGRENGRDATPLEETDTSLIYKINDTHVDFAVELSWMCRVMRREVVLSPQALLMISKSSHVDMKKDIIVRDLDILRANAYPTRPRLKVFELIAFEHVGSHDPGVLKAIRHYETGIKAYRASKFRDAMISFQHAISITNDPPSLVMHQRCAHYLRHRPPQTWQGDFELSESVMLT